MPLNALLFDLDGTLLDTNEQHARAWQRALDHLGYRVPTPRIMPEIGKGGDRVVPALVGEKTEQRHGGELRKAQGEAYRRIVEEEGVRLFPQAEALLEAVRARSLRAALVTGSGAEDLDTVLAQAGLDADAHFEAVVTSGDADETKPSPAPVEAALEKLELAPGLCAAVGDTPYDARAAARAGVVTLGVRSGGHSAEALHRAGARASYADPGALLDNLEGALRRAAPEQKPLSPPHLEDLMQEALDEAWAGLSEGELPIGSAVARGDGRIAGRGHNRAQKTGSRVAHAEMMALADAADELEAGDGAVLATTVEPCTMCLGAAMEAGIDTVVYAMPAPANGGTGRVTPPGTGHLPRLIGGARAEGSRALLRRWRDRHPENAFAGQPLDAEE
jgi:HAD superfamily hydrolase (TIGR01509 family)